MAFNNIFFYVLVLSVISGKTPVQYLVEYHIQMRRQFGAVGLSLGGGDRHKIRSVPFQSIEARTHFVRITSSKGGMRWMSFMF